MRRKEQVGADRRTLVNTAQVLDDGTDVGERLTFDYALALVKAELVWLEPVLVEVVEEGIELVAVSV